MFIGRERELSSLEKLYRSDKFEFAVVYGRRRVGKTALLSHFIKDKNSIYFMGIESNAKQNLENFSRSILESDSRNPAESVFLTFQSALEYVFRRSEQERIILVIDEYPYVARSSKSFSSVLQRQIVKDFLIKFTKNLQKRCQKHCMAPDTSFDRLHFSVQQVFAEIRIVWQLVDIWLPAPLDFGQFQRIGFLQCMIVACHI